MKRESLVEMYSNFLYLYTVASTADGACAQIEVDEAVACLKEWWETNPHPDPSILTEAWGRVSGWIEREGTSTQRVTTAAKMLLGADIGTRQAFLNDLVRIARADGSIHGNEKIYCNTMANVWGLARPFDESR